MQQLIETLPAPYPDDSTNLIYNMIFCDDIDLFKSKNKAFANYPWNILMSGETDVPGLQKITQDKELESRLKILAYNKLRVSGEEIKSKELLAVIVEIGLDEGLDILAAFRDGTARYINHTGRMIILETTDATSTSITNELFEKSEVTVAKIGPWDKPRRDAPEKGKARISFLVADGLYFGEAPVETLFGDPLAAGALQSATELLQYITTKVQ